MLRKYILNPNHVIEYESLMMEMDSTYEEQPIQIVVQKDQVLRHCTIPYMLLQWKKHSKVKVTWKLEEEVRNNQPYLF